MDICFILWVKIHFYRYLFCCSQCFSFGHWEFFLVGSCVLLTQLIPFFFFPLCLFLSTSLLSLTRRYLTCPSPKISVAQPFLLGSLALVHKIVFSNHAVSMLAATGVSIFWALPVNSPRKSYLCILTHIYAHLYFCM